MNNILNELKEARKYMIETDDNIEGIVKIKVENVAKVEAMIKNDSAYIRSGDELSKPVKSKKGNIKYPGSSAYWITQLKDILIKEYKESSDNYTYEECIKESINAIDRENSTHLNADGVGRNEISERIMRIKRDKMISFLKEPEKDNYELIRAISESTTGGRKNFSFATKFCHYMCFYLFKGKKEQDNFSIYDGVLANALPKYCEKYNIEFEQKEFKDNYNIYLEIIDRIRNKAQKEYGEKISRNGFDHLIWYFHKGRN